MMNDKELKEKTNEKRGPEKKIKNTQGIIRKKKTSLCIKLLDNRRVRLNLEK